MTRENATRNGLDEQVRADTSPIEAVAERFPVVVANIEARVLVPMASALGDRVEQGGLLVLAGILGSQRDEVRAAYSRFALEDAPDKGEWVALVLRAPPAASG